MYFFIKKTNTIKTHNRGFTLIELLVVISIIALLSSVTIASVRSAQFKSRESFIKTSLTNIQKQVEILGFDESTYVAICSDTKVTQIVNSMNKGGIKANCKNYQDGSFGNLWGVSAIIPSSPNSMFSVSSMGVAIWDTSYNPDPTMNQDNAKIYCEGKGGRLPSETELESLYVAYGSNPGFVGSYYWGRESSSNNFGILTDMSYGGKAAVSKYATDRYVRCVK